MRWLAVLAFIPAVAHADFTFKVPPGWTDLSPNAPAANFAKIEPVLAAQFRQATYTFFAADLDGRGDGFMENVNATVYPKPHAINLAELKEIGEQIDAEVKKVDPRFSMQILDTKVVKIGGVECGRYIGLLTMGDKVVQQISYLLPGRNEHAVLTYSTVPAQFKRYQPVFDAAAKATVGIAPR